MSVDERDAVDSMISFTSARFGTTTTRRVILGVGANALGKIWVLIWQLLSVPLLIHFWGVSAYGKWLMLTAVPTYIALGDLGFASAAGVDMTKRVALNDFDGALVAFQSLWAFINGICCVIAVPVCTLWFFRHDLSYIIGVNSDDIIKAGFLLAIYSLLVLQMSVAYGAFRSSGLYALGTFLFDIFNLIEGCTLLITATLGGRFVAAAGSMLAIRTLGCGFYYFTMRRTVEWAHFGLSHASFSEVRGLAKPALAALSLPFSNALNIQGIVFIVGAALSPASAALFSIARTITRVPLQLTGIVTRASIPEFTIAHASKDHAGFNRLAMANLLGAALATLPIAFSLIFCGNFLLHLLTGGSLSAPPGLFILMVMVMVLQTFWNTVGAFLLALNLQERFSYFYAGISFISIIVCYFVARSDGLVAMAVVLAIAETGTAFAVARAWRKTLDVRLAALVSGGNDVIRMFRVWPSIKRR